MKRSKEREPNRPSPRRIAMLDEAQLTRVTGGFAPVPGMASGTEGTHLAGIDGAHPG